MRYTEPSNGVDDLYFIHGDQSGSAVLITDDTGQEVGRAHYEPFGETFSSTIPMTLTERLFSGQVLDSSTGLYYYGNGRYYDPSIGRYISPDPYLDAPFSSQRLDRYNFGFNNPLRYKRSEALPDFTVDLAKGIVVAEGVPASALTSSFGQLTVDLEGARWLVKETFGAVADAGVQQAFGGYVIGRISITASKTRLTRMLPKHVRALFPKIRTLKGTYTKQTVSTLLIRSASEVDHLRVAAHPLTVAKPGSGISRKWAGRVTRQMARLDVIGSLVLAGVIEGGFSLYEDLQMRDIYGLTNAQIATRALVRIGGGVLAAYVGLTVAAMVGGPAVVVAAAGIMAAVAVQAAWDWWVAPLIFRWRDLYGPYEPRPAVMTSANRLKLLSP